MNLLLELDEEDVRKNDGKITKKENIKASLITLADEWIWAGNYRENARIQVLAPSSVVSYNDTIPWAEIIDGICVGDHITACKAQELGFDAVLNVAEEMDVHIDSDEYADTDFRSRNRSSAKQPILHKKIPIPDGQCYVIAPEFIKEAVNWLIENRGKRILSTSKPQHLERSL